MIRLFKGRGISQVWRTPPVRNQYSGASVCRRKREANQVARFATELNAHQGDDYARFAIGEDNRVRGNAVPLLKGDFKGQSPVNPLPGYKPAREGFIDWVLKPFKHQ